MKKLLSTACILAGTFSLFANDSIFVKEPNVPILTDRTDNVLYNIRIYNSSNKQEALTAIQLEFDKNVPVKDIRSVKLFYAGTEAPSRKGQFRFAPLNYLARENGKFNRVANRSYSILRDSIASPSRKVTFKTDQKLFPGINYFWVSIEMKPEADLNDKITSEITGVTIDKQKETVFRKGEKPVRRLGYGVRHAGDDEAAAYRIPGMVTTNEGTLLAVYDIRYNNGVDLQIGRASCRERVYVLV